MLRFPAFHRNIRKTSYRCCVCRAIDQIFEIIKRNMLPGSQYPKGHVCVSSRRSPSYLQVYQEATGSGKHWRGMDVCQYGSPRDVSKNEMCFSWKVTEWQSWLCEPEPEPELCLQGWCRDTAPHSLWCSLLLTRFNSFQTHLQPDLMYSRRISLK